MVFQANKWGWKALAARMLLAPVLAGSLVAPAFAQTGAKVQPAATATAPSDPKEALKQGRKALAEGRFDEASKLAQVAAAGNPSGRWGLLADTPDALLKDVKTARAKADKVMAVALTKEAKELYGKAAKSDAERLTNLDAAAVKIDRAVTLGGSDWVDDLNPFAEKPEALKRSIDSSRAALRKNMPVAQADARGTSPVTGGVRTAAATAGTGFRQAKLELESASPTAAGGEKVKAQVMMKAGRALMAEGKLADARAKFVEAAKQGGTFALTEDNPDKCLQEVAQKGKDKVDGLTAEASKYAAGKEYAKAEAALGSAKEVAVSLDLWTRAIDLELDALKKVAGTTQVAAIDPPAAKPEATKAAPLPDIPSLTVPTAEPPAAEPAKPSLPPLPVAEETKKPTPLPPVEVKPAKPVEPVKVAADTKADQGRKLLDQATAELKRGELEMARKLAVEVHNGDFGLKDDAQKLMVAIDAESKVGKAKEAAATFDAAVSAYNAKQYEHADRLFAGIDATLLPADKLKKYEDLTKLTAGEVAKIKAPTPTADVAKAPTGLIPSTPTAPQGGVLETAKTMAEAEIKQFQVEGLQVQSQALKAFERGETDLAVTLLTDFSTKVKASKLSAARQKVLLDPVEAKLENFRLIKRQVDLYTKDAKDKRERIEQRMAKSTAEQQKQEEIAKRVRDIRDLMQKKHYAEAEKLALQAKQLDPDNETLSLIHALAKNNRRVDEARQLKSDREEAVLVGLNEAERVGPAVSMDKPLVSNIERALMNRNRVSGDEQFTRPRSNTEREIEVRLEKPLTVEFKQASLREVIDRFADVTKVNLSVDEPAIAADSLDLDKVLVTEKFTQPIALRNVMQVILDKHRLQYVIENDMVQITTQKKAKGRMYTKVYSVMDLVTPIPDFALPDHATLDKTFTRLNTPTQPWVNAQAAANSALGTGQLVSQPWGQPGAAGGKGGGILENQGMPGSPQTNPLSGSAYLAPTKANHSEQLMKLIKGMVRPYSWEDSGGAGKVSYYDIGGALVVNQTADVIREVNDLLESLRRLQDLSVAVEVRIVSLSESFFERIGVDFQMNFTTKPSSSFERALTTNAFRPDPFINSLNGQKNVTVGWDPTSGGFTPDLGVPIRPNTYGFSAPPFGGYPGNGQGGLNLGLAFLNDIQVFMFLEASAGDRRANVMQAPKLTLFNGQTGTITINDFTFFTTGLNVINVGGQFVYTPTNTPFPTGATVTVQPVVSSDRRFVRMTITPNLTEITSATVPLFPVTAFITPVFEGGSQGTPIPFTQFFQQPSFANFTIQATVVVPDGGTVMLGGIKRMSEGRNEFGPPVLSNIPYLNRLFRNTGIGRETTHVMFMVTPRIIITSEEEAVQTGQGNPLGGGN